MLTRKEIAEAKAKALKMFEDNKIAYTKEEEENFEVSDFGLSMLDKIGLELIVYVNNNIYCAKEMGLLPYQICPEHRHPTRGDKSGKMETFRCRAGEVYLYVSGDPTENIKGKVPEGKEDTFTVFHEIVLHPGEQYTIMPDTLHWFQSGPDGAIVSEFSTTSTDEDDVFTDPEIKRFTEIAD